MWQSAAQPACAGTTSCLGNSIAGLLLLPVRFSSQNCLCLFHQADAPVDIAESPLTLPVRMHSEITLYANRCDLIVSSHT